MQEGVFALGAGEEQIVRKSFLVQTIALSADFAEPGNASVLRVSLAQIARTLSHLTPPRVGMIAREGEFAREMSVSV